MGWYPAGGRSAGVPAILAAADDLPQCAVCWCRPCCAVAAGEDHATVEWHPTEGEGGGSCLLVILAWGVRVGGFRARSWESGC